MPDPITEGILKLYEAKAREESARIAYETAQAKTGALGRSAVPDAIAEITAQQQKQQAQQQKIAEQGAAQQQQGPIQMAPPQVPVTGETRVGGQAGRALLEGLSQQQQAGGPQPAAVQEPGAALPPGASVQAGAPGTVQPITQQLTGGQRALSGFGGFLGLLGRSPQALVEFGGQALTGKRELGLQRLPSEEELAQQGANVAGKARMTGEAAGLREWQQQLITTQSPDVARRVIAQASVMDRTQAIEEEKQRTGQAVKWIEGSQQAGYPAEVVKRGSDLIMSNRYGEFPALLAAAAPGITDAQVRGAQFEGQKLQNEYQQRQLRLLTNLEAAQDSETDDLFQRTHVNVPSPYAPTAGGLGLTPTGRLGMGGAAKRPVVLTPDQINDSYRRILGKPDTGLFGGGERELDMAAVAGANQAQLQEYYMHPSHPVKLHIPGKGIQTTTTHDELFDLYSTMEGLRYTAGKMSQAAGREITTEEIMDDPKLRDQALTLQREAAGKVEKLLGISISGRRLEDGRLVFEWDPIDILGTEDEFQLANAGVVNDIIGGLEIEHTKLIKMAGLTEEQLVLPGEPPPVPIESLSPAASIKEALKVMFGGRRTPGPVVEEGAARLRSAGRRRPEIGERVGPPPNPKSFETPEQSQTRRLLEAARTEQEKRQASVEALRSRR